MKSKSKLKFQISRGSDSTSELSYESNSYYKDCNYYNRNITDKLREDSKCEIKRICKKYELNYKVMRVIVNLDFNPDLHYLVKVNRMIYDHNFYGDWKYFINE